MLLDGRGFFFRQIDEGADSAGFLLNGGLFGFIGGCPKFRPQFPQFRPAAASAGNFAISFHASHFQRILRLVKVIQNLSEPTFYQGQFAGSTSQPSPP
jgi:hypothetical protein